MEKEEGEYTGWTPVWTRDRYLCGSSSSDTDTTSILQTDLLCTRRRTCLLYCKICGFSIQLKFV